MRALVLLVDDNDDAREMYSTYLTYKGLRVVCAHNAPRGIALAREQRPDVILMDLRLPGMTGTEAMRVLRADSSFSGVPIVALTAHALDDERRQALRDGFNGVLSKPCLPDALFDALVDLLGQWRPESISN